MSDPAREREILEREEFVRREFEKWRDEKQRGLEIAQRSFVNAWAGMSWLADSRREAMGRELAKAQARIGRQRKANREVLSRLSELEEENEKLKSDLRTAEEFYGNRVGGLEEENRRLRETIEARLELRRKGRPDPHTYDEFENALVWVLEQMALSSEARGMTNFPDAWKM